MVGLGPHGERAALAEQVALSPNDVSTARAREFRIAIVLHTMAGEWSIKQLAGIMATLEACEATVVKVIDCGFAPDMQIDALDRLIGERPDAIISIPVANARVAEAHRRVSQAGIRLLLLDNVPTGLLPGSDYVALVSADNFGLGAIAASLLADRLAPDAVVGVIAYISEFFVTNEREIAFGKWMRANRPDVRLVVRKFDAIDVAGEKALALVAAEPELAGIFVVWDTPAMEVVRVLDDAGRRIPITTIDLGREAALDLAAGGMICGIGAQQPYLQGTAVAQACILALLERTVPAWIALRGLAVSFDTAAACYQDLYGTPLE